ncbi:nuclear protein localization protein 4 [Phlyctochytrium planicorne]|nr:nuclear protein localization protein 4 [Phlyctochytrium planicorne]
MPTLRVRSPDGLLRVEVNPQLGPDHVLAKISEAVKLPPSHFVVTKDQGYSQPFSAADAVSIRHGDMVFVKYSGEPLQQSTGSFPTGSGSTSTPSPAAFVPVDPLDAIMEKDKGLIKRSKNVNFCRHGDSGMCDYCMPLEPYDATYMETNKIKHMSYHAYLRQVTTQAKTGAPTSSNFIPPLDEQSFTVKVPCPSRTHNPFPQGICTKCQPSSIILQSQNFRMVDHVEFESFKLIDGVVNFWRQTGYQRYGLMFGRYEPYPEVPLGIKAVVSAIYEPPQDCAPDMIQLQLPDNQENEAVRTAASLGLQLIGIIYTDLLDDGSGKGTVICKRHAKSYFLSSAECIYSAAMQDRYPHVTRYSATTKFGSRLVTCVVSGQADGTIEVTPYQVSNVGVALARDGIIEASADPGLMRVKQSTNDHYVPELFYKYKNEYGLMVQEAAKPTFPVDYLLLSHGFPHEPKPLFLSEGSFPVENRGGIETQNMESLKRSLGSQNLGMALSNFHILFFLRTSGVLEEADLELIGKIVRDRKDADVGALMSRPTWGTLQVILSETDASMGGGGGSGAGGASGSGSRSRDPWTCKFCTFVNISGGESCEVCGLPNE